MKRDIDEIIFDIAKARGENVESVKSKFSLLELSKAPSMNSCMNHLPVLKEIEFQDAGLDNGIPYVKMNDGHVYYGHKSKPQQKRQFEFIKDLISKKINNDTFAIAQDVAMRINSDTVLPPKQVYPPKNGIIVECGAYLGHKTIRFAEELVPKGKILAIELVPENVQILQKNIVANNLEDRIEVLNCGVWHEPGVLEVKGKGFQRNTLVELEKLTDKTGLKIKVDNLDNILDKWGKKFVDLLFITINGAEIEAINGLNKWLSKIGIIWVVSPYKRDGKNNRDICISQLKEKKCKILNLGDSSSKIRKNVIFSRQIFANPSNKDF